MFYTYKYNTNIYIIDFGILYNVPVIDHTKNKVQWLMPFTYNVCNSEMFS